MMLARSILFISAVLLIHSTAYSSDLPKRCQKAVDSKNSEDIIKRCFSAADDGNPEAAFRMGEAYDFSNLAPENADKALYWYNKAAQVGHILAQRNLAALYDGGYGQHRDTFKAFYWYHKAAQQGQPHSQLMTGMMYLYGSGTPQNSEQAKHWFQQAALSGEPNGQYMYGKILYEEEPEQALEWYQRSAAQNNGYALYQLSLMHYLGQHLLKSDEVALTMADKAIRTGHDKAVILKEKLLGRIRNQDFKVAESSVEKREAPLITKKADESKTSAVKAIEVAERQDDKQQSPKPSAESISTDQSPASEPVVAARSSELASELAKAEINKTPIKPAVSVKAETTSTENKKQTVETKPKTTAKKQTKSKDDSEWLLAQPKTNYTIQLALMSQYDSIKRFGRFYPAVDDTHYYVSEFPKGKLYMLVKGSYSSWSEAKEALNGLPEKVKKTKPWIRQFDKLQSQYVRPEVRSEARPN